MSIGSILDRVIPTAVGFATGGAQGAMVAATSVEASKKAQKRAGAQQLEYERSQMDSRFDSFGPTSGPIQDPRDATMGFFDNIGQSIGDFGRGASRFVQNIAPALDLFGVGGGASQGAQGPARTIVMQGPGETSSSGELLGANLGMGANLIQAAGRFVRSPGGQAALGFGAGAVGAALSGGGNGAPRVTRRMKSDVRRIYMMAGMDPNMTAQILNNMGTYPRMNFDASLVFFILTKRFRNDGPVVTKAAVRKTKTTLRRMKGVVDMYNSVCKPTTRRAPMRRAAPKAVQLIKN